MLNLKDKIALVSLLVELMSADNYFSEPEKKLLNNMCNRLSIDQETFQKGYDFDPFDAMDHIKTLPEYKKDLIATALMDMLIIDDGQNNPRELAMINQIAIEAGLSDSINKLLEQYK